MTLLDTILDNNYKTISIVGMAKNAGKTVTLNSIIDEAYYRGVTLGITSTGRDGERVDIVTETEKPRIYAPVGSIIATSEKTLSLGDAKIEIINVTDYKTPMGNVVIGRVIDGGYVQIAGPQNSSELKKVSDTMVKLGADIVLIDGAINRISSSSPFISDGTILSTGAVISRDIRKVISETIYRLELFSLPKVEDIKILETSKTLMDRGKIAIINDEYNINYLDIKTALNGGLEISKNIKDNTKYVFLPGSLAKKTLEDIVKSGKRYKNIKFIIKDGTKIFVDSRSWLIFKKRGVKVEVIERINTIALTLNPYSPYGYYFNNREFLSRMKDYIKGIPVFDVVQGGEEYEDFR